MPKNPTQELLDVALHPVRMRILMLLAGSQGLTPQQMAEQMSDVPQATLYRHINRLVKAGLLAVSAENPVRGTLEKVYVLDHAARVTADGGSDPFAGMTPADHLRYFTAYVMNLLDDFSRYVQRAPGGAPDYLRDGVGYHKMPLHLSDDELAAFSAALNQALLPFLQLPPAPGRKKRLFATIFMPFAGSAPESAAPESAGLDEPTE